MRHINLFRALPVGCAIAAADYVVLSRFSHGSVADVAAVIVGVVAAAVFYVRIRLGRMPWFEKRDGKAHAFILWLEDAFPWLRGRRE